MLIHSVTPAHMLMPAEAIPEPSYKQVGGSYLEGHDTPEGFQISRIHSTDPAMYLKTGHAPGSIYREGTGLESGSK